MGATALPLVPTAGQSPARRLQTDLPTDEAFVGPIFTLLEGYSGVSAGNVEGHLKKIRDKAWTVHPYGCIGLWRFVDLHFSRTPEYPEVLARVCAGAVFLDVGCCLGQTLRQLAWDGAPAKNLTGVDLYQDFIDLGYKLFRDRGRVDVDGSGEERPMRFATGSILEEDDPGLRALDGTADIANASSVFHLFGWEDQVRAGCCIVRFLRKPRRSRSPLGWRLGGSSSGRGAEGGWGRAEGGRSRRGSPYLEVGAQPAASSTAGPMILGWELGDHKPLSREAHEAKGLVRYHHNPKTLQRLWDEIGERTGTRWRVWAEMLDMKNSASGAAGAGSSGITKEGAAARSAAPGTAEKTTTVIRYVIRWLFQ